MYFSDFNDDYEILDGVTSECCCADAILVSSEIDAGDVGGHGAAMLEQRIYCGECSEELDYLY